MALLFFTLWSSLRLHYIEANMHGFLNKYYLVITSSCYTKKGKGVLIAAKLNLSYTNLDTGEVMMVKLLFTKWLIVV